MVAPLIFLTTLYVMVDDFCQAHLPPEIHPGPPAPLTRSEVVTLALFAQWAVFTGERDFYRYAARHLRAACIWPTACTGARTWMRRWIPPPCPPVTPGAGGPAGCPARRRSAGAMAAAGSRACASCFP